ncbi:serine/threonine protein kinase [Christensenellaceae bacterium NSJ-63]|uniref:non-specific serine/threonine protein kinase n=1 Tax=Guopingia tenuis TaxID=2763656 RepID=A0A926HT75_9FIRM|nr:serine/threonine-protein kinase [Guopingia tenuis]MBC8539207.1 serine/threonine protein kinase [Guopingia tenuis]
MELSWLKDKINENYDLKIVLKQTGNSFVAVYQHKTLGKKLIVRQCRGSLEVFKKLKQFRDIHICSIYDVAEADGTLLILEEFIEGTTLANILQTRLFTPKETVLIAKQICYGLHVLHSKGIVHRDIKPENIIFDQNHDNRVIIIDFSAARIFKKYHEKDTQVMGTVGYAAPEQFGEAQTDARSDIYALGILLNVMLTGAHPSKCLAKGSLSKIIQKCINPIPSKRFNSVLELAKKLY